ncbi:MAG: hypothetical protein A3H69_01600 [Candidatus Sungbacteria bacterium RIFCSPLOWO2_02_FULL_47_9]|uniref:Band 7 domain-containing protein n=1 Tax=Candidatus Sungbacteria bacterium RIFCSPHIGHO2_01_FULL_47_32 TaxID=1802264 RepID=A0A1G2K3U1_9BACT|nr:MAG: hypothetical protein A2633_03930 [Candidatus Sungbacteria bacterium RIFCSPHIGHO2_01_FULL_47_32]OHA05278.1 MAG: hypothetical protein A3A28_01675 [Candidatus Sungbacteria bacterium RIFCSPLOWO2_01_FULL_47_32]OHA11746.1 MAG: hypothetical protein A3H69_01600 [Candidatus Sungbacteria bacterium RIFCSPLOWO2_02_FULL_47_9]
MKTLIRRLGIYCAVSFLVWWIGFCVIVYDIFVRNPRIQMQIDGVLVGIFAVGLVVVVFSSIKTKAKDLKDTLKNKASRVSANPGPSSSNTPRPGRRVFNPKRFLEIVGGILVALSLYFFGASILAFLVATWGRIVFAVAVPSVITGIIYGSYFKNTIDQVSVFEWHIPFFRSPRKCKRIGMSFFEQGYGTNVYAVGIHFAFLWKVFAKIHCFEIKDFIVPDGMVGVVIARDGKERSGKDGQAVAKPVESDGYRSARKFILNDGEMGPQPGQVLPGTYIMHPFLFSIEKSKAIEIKFAEKNDPTTGERTFIPQVGIVTALVGKETPEGQVFAAEPTLPHNNFQDTVAFIQGGGGKGAQRQMLEMGLWFPNPYVIKIDEIPAVHIKEGEVGVMISNIGENPADEDLERAGERPVNNVGETPEPIYILKKGVKKRGIRGDTLKPGFHSNHPVANEIRIVDVTPDPIRWDTSESTQFDPIAVITKDPFRFELDAELIAQVNPEDAPKVVAYSGSFERLVRDIIHPVMNDIIRDEASTRPIAEFLEKRNEVRHTIEERLKVIFGKYFIKVVSFRIADIGFQRSTDEGLKRYLDLRKRKVTADQHIATIEADQRVEVARRALERTRAIANNQGALVDAKFQLKVAEIFKKTFGERSQAYIALFKEQPDESTFLKLAELAAGDPEFLSKFTEVIAGLVPWGSSKKGSGALAPDPVA